MTKKSLRHRWFCETFWNGCFRYSTQTSIKFSFLPQFSLLLISYHWSFSENTRKPCFQGGLKEIKGMKWASIKLKIMDYSWPISCHWSLSGPPANTRKPVSWCFLGAYGVKRLNVWIFIAYTNSGYSECMYSCFPTVNSYNRSTLKSFILIFFKSDLMWQK